VIQQWLGLLPFSPEPFAFSSTVQKCKGQNIQDYNFVYGSVYVRNLASVTKGGTQAEGTKDQSAVDNIWTEEG
jgi:hypothetical protein